MSDEVDQTCSSTYASSKLQFAWFAVLYRPYDPIMSSANMSSLAFRVAEARKSYGRERRAIP